jgi:hypothetical protein
MTPNRKLLLCLVGNFIVLGFVIIIIFLFATTNPYWNYGPQEDLILISVRINTIGNYIGLLAVIALVEFSRIVVEELGMPVLQFNIYNPDKKIIDEFSKNELQFYANAMYFVSGMRNVFLVMVTISQIDIALWTVVVSQIATVLTVRLLLNEKTFTKTTTKPPGYELSPMNI